MHGGALGDSRAAPSGTRHASRTSATFVRVLHLRSGFSFLTETFLYDELTELERRFGGQHVVTRRHVNAGSRPFPRVHELKGPGRLAPRRLASRLLSVVGRLESDEVPWAHLRHGLAACVARVEPSVIHAHFGPEGVLAAPVAQAAGLPLITSFYGFDASRLLDAPLWRRRFAQGVFRGQVVALSRLMADRLVATGADPARVHIIHLGTRVEAYDPRPPTRVRRLLSVGRMTEKKGHGDMLRGFRTAAAVVPDARLDLVGDGSLMGRIRCLVADLGLEDRVALHGAVPHGEVRAMLARADAFVLCSRTAEDGDTEGTPTVLVEAQAAGLPCISTHHAGIPETVAPENHDLLIPEGDPEAVARVMEVLFRAPPGRLREISDHGRRHVEANFDLGSQARALHRLYRSVASRG